ncbi:MAG TPA: GNAT family N-acetyltransferase [Bryobacteraceae bacterium]|nr:GNAT family N-acetyltransferase [Bryobacteraceae bacterium]
MSRIRIVPATEVDLPVILDLVRALAEYERLAASVTATEEQLRRTLFGSKPAAEVLLAYWDRECAGFAVFFPTYSTFLAQAGIYLEDLYVKPHLRGKGIGLALLRHLSRITTERGCGRLEWGVLKWNEPAIQFYRKLGATQMDEWTQYRLAGDALESMARGTENPDKRSALSG